MQLIDENGDIVDEWTSDGENHIITNIPAGGYTLKEVAAPDGYVIATDIEKQPRLRNNGGSSSNLYRLTDVPKEVDNNV